MGAVLVFAVVLYLAVLVSDWARRSVLSMAVLFLLAGFAAGSGVSGLLHVTADNVVLSQFAQLALFSVLFTDGMRVGVRDLLSAWRLPGRALLLGMPLTMAITATLARALVNLSWSEAILLGAVLSPTDPVFAAAIVGREEVPGRLRYLLNVESGLNDGLALPVVIAFIHASSGQGFDVVSLLADVCFGIAIGVAVPFLCLSLERLPIFRISTRFEALDLFGIGLIILSITSLTHANEFLAAFAGGITTATMLPDAREKFGTFGEHVTDLLKLAALLMFGALISPHFLLEISWQGYLFMIAVLVAARSIALFIALFGSELEWHERLVAAWFGPKGFASVVYGLYILNSAVPHAAHLSRLVALVVVVSIIAHSSTAVLVARWFEVDEAEQLPLFDGEAHVGARESTSSA